MKPNFALSLSFEGIRLLQRAAGGWHLLGEVSVSDPGLAEALATLRRTGEAAHKGPLQTKLIIPDEQIRYLSIQTPGQDATARHATARAALDGATPYEVDALAFDISPDGDTTHVAAVARETLLEAEEFAAQHGFAPLSFVAAGIGADFLGEPFFGPTAFAQTALPSGSEVEPDGVRVVIVDKPAPADATEVAEPVVTADAAQDAPPQAEEAEADAAMAPADTPAPRIDADMAPETPPSDSDDTVLIVPPSDAAPQEATPEADLPDQAPVDDAEQATEPDATETVHASVMDAEAEAEPEAYEGQDDADPEPTTPPLLGFATRRRRDPSSHPAPISLGGVSRSAPQQSKAPTLSAPAALSARASDLSDPIQSAADSLRPTEPPLPATPTDSTPSFGATTRERLGGFLSRRTVPVETVGVPHAATSGASKQVGTERLPMFGARTDGAVGGKPRFLGLILTAVLLVFLAGVAAWASVFLDDGLARLFPARERTLASTLPDDTRASLAEDVGATTEREPDPEAVADGVVVAALNDSLSEDGLSAEDVAVLDALRDPLPDPIAPEDLDASALEARYAVTGIWPKAPDAPIPGGLVDLEDLYVTSIDPVSPALDAVALPRAASFVTDRQLALITSPAAAGTNFARDAQGRIVPTVSGALSPDGFTVFLGRPPVVPPATLARLEVEEQANPNTEALAQARPRIRPENLVEQNERATLGGLSRTELAALRPRLRPQAPQEIEAETAPEEAPETVPAAEPDVVVVATLRPQTRPRNFQRIVARATPAPQEAPAQTASVAPRTVTPSIPSSASVTREATVRNAINLRRVNLIGVYGTPSNRRALVRLANGRYKKVEIGDRFDGGRVSAIGESELRYQKGGRNVVLKMPQG